MTLSTPPALARIGAGRLALAAPDPSCDWLAVAEDRASRVLAGTPSENAVAQRAYTDAGGKSGKPYHQFGTVAVISVAGLLLKDWSWIGDDWATGYTQIKWQIELALEDADITGIALHIDSGGGLVDGLFSLTAFIREAREKKPIVAIVDGCAASAAYAIASACTSISAPQFSATGSIGVLSVHWDFSKALSNFGVVPTVLFAGAHKVDGNSLQVLPDSVKDEWLVELEAIRRFFAADVAAGRGDAMDAAAALKTEARCYGGVSGAATAKKLGLIDQVLSPDEAMVAFVTHLAAQAA